MKKITKLTVLLIGGITAVSFLTNSFFTDSESSTGNQFVASNYYSPPSLMITEVFYNPPGPAGTEIGAEWIEVYNTTDSVIDFQNWSIVTISGTASFNSSAPIQPHTFAILAHNQNVRTTWGLPVTTNVIVATSWVQQLLNPGDAVELKNPSAVTIDGMSYGTITTIFNPSAGPLAENHSLERLVLTVDTDTAADWVDNASPTPDAPHP